ncbi:hypothetical protein LWF01_02480 [Saxibacter everestensis]|uniref:ATP-binding protein n=1 Tax=Saxibacter everestensis TaxID=2909229 RepID=A0ABY8QWQ9_9MICO|nr:hypothetical protein LWF01_02480 [Brevibacteriaceae bacterium ZFBP1038]
MSQPGADRLGIPALRQAVITTWTASPRRFREDANAEQELLRGGYRDRAILELAQNAADAAEADASESADAAEAVGASESVSAAEAAGASESSGRIRFEIQVEHGQSVLYAANTGKPLTSDGVAALGSLRASAKRDSRSTGRFGVGFVAVLGLSSEPTVHSTSGAVGFSVRRSAQLLAELAGPAAEEIRAELAGRAGQLPVLRLPFEPSPDSDAEATIGRLLAAGFTTVVRLPLDQPGALSASREQLDNLGDATLLALPALGEISVSRHRPDADGEAAVAQQPAEKVIRDVAARWMVERRTGHFSAADVANLPAEDQGRRDWWLAWALPRDGRTGQDSVIYAPTPSDDGLSLPGLLIGSFPVESGRRHLTDSKALQLMLRAAAQAYATLVARRARELTLEGSPTTALAGLAGFVPTGMPLSAADAVVHQAVINELGDVAWLPLGERIGDEPAALVRPDQVAALTGAGSELAQSLRRWSPDLLPVDDQAVRSALRRVGVTEVTLDIVLENIHTSDPGQARDLFAALTPAARDALAREAMASLAVPMADGTTRRGVRGLSLPTGLLDAGLLTTLGIVTIHPDAAHPLLLDLGAEPANAASVLNSLDGTLGMQILDGDELSGAERDGILTVVRAWAGGDPTGGEAGSPFEADPVHVEPLFLSHPWLAELELPDAAGEPTPAADLYLPGSPAEDLTDRDDFYRLDPGAVSRWGSDVLASVGVQTGLRLVTGRELVPGGGGIAEADAPTEAWLDDLVDEYSDQQGEPYVPEAAIILGLDVVSDGAWPVALQMIDGDPQLRAALTREVQVVIGDRRVGVPSPARAWIRRHALHDGKPLGELASAELAASIDGLDPAPEWCSRLTPDVRAAILLTDVEAVDGDRWLEVLDGLKSAGIARCISLWDSLAQSDVELDAPSELVGLVGTEPTLLQRNELFVASAPHWLQRGDLGGALRASWDAGHERAEGLAHALDLPLGEELADGEISTIGDEQALPPALVQLLTALGVTALPRWFLHERLEVDGHEVDWWVEPGSDRPATLHSSTMHGLSRSLALVTGRWQLRDVLAAVAAGELSPDEALLELG